MVIKIQSLLKKMIDFSRTNKDYLEFLQFTHRLLFEELGINRSLFIIRLGDLFFKSTYQHAPETNWDLRTNEVFDTERFLKLATIAQKENELDDQDHLKIEINWGVELQGMICVPADDNQDDNQEILIELKDFFYLICNSLYKQYQLNERVKEISCLHTLNKLGENKELSIAQFLTETVKLLPPAWQFPEFTRARIIYNDESFTTPDFNESKYTMRSQLIIGNLSACSIEINYPPEFCTQGEYPFLKEEEHLLETIAGELNMILEKKKAKEESRRLEKQLLHADRLVTLGQLSAGIAHEINEPLTGILGLAQLMEKNESLDHQAKSDLENIVSASLHAREVVKKLMLFARQMPASQSHINLNDSVKNAVFFLESRCRKNMITIAQKLAKDIPDIVADPSQIHQVLINLIVNALQAMPEGGRISLSTRFDEENVYLECRDTGIGMDKRTLSQIFNPFFTTKKVNEGTGLGLSVVHGIVYSHHGDIKAKSKPGEGAVFNISFPRLNKVE
jgi:signal transduction histidine kinase